MRGLAERVGHRGVMVVVSENSCGDWQDVLASVDLSGARALDVQLGDDFTCVLLVRVLG